MNKKNDKIGNINDEKLCWNIFTKKISQFDEYIKSTINVTHNNNKNEKTFNQSMNTIIKKAMNDKYCIKMIKQMKNQLNSFVNFNDSNILENVIGFEFEKRVIKEYIIYPFWNNNNMKIDYDYDYMIGDYPKCIMFYGLAGVGKTYLCRTICNELKNVVKSNMGDFVSGYIGDSVTMMKKLFNVAICLQPSVIFVDEIDFFVGTIEILRNEFWIQMEKIKRLKCKIVVLSTSQIPWKLEKRILNMFKSKIFLDVTKSLLERKNLLKLELLNVENTLTEGEFDKISELTENYTFSDIKTFVRDAIMNPVRKIMEASHFKKIDGKFSPCNEFDEGAMYMSYIDMNGDQLNAPKVIFSDFLEKSNYLKISDGLALLYYKFRNANNESFDIISKNIQKNIFKEHSFSDITITAVK